LKECGFSVKLNRTPKRGFGDIVANAKLVAEIGQVCNELDRPVHLIGHSLGGLIAMEADSHAVFDSITTLGTPHAGTNLARLAPSWLSVSATQMRPGSSHLAQGSEWPFAPLFSVAARYDSLIHPLDSAIHPRSDKELWVNTTHLGLVFSKKVTYEVMEYLVSLTNH
jgi:pimeloyl-ACP methyl ester carboxylesterase